MRYETAPKFGWLTTQGCSLRADHFERRMHGEKKGCISRRGYD
ncbi:uncharacterized protein METZ01_LOCUS104386, partial [marine metagenome]